MIRAAALVREARGHTHRDGRVGQSCPFCSIHLTTPTPDPADLTAIEYALDDTVCEHLRYDCLVTGQGRP